MSQGARCIFCGKHSTDIPGKFVVSSERRYGKDRSFWGVCSTCLFISLQTVVAHREKLGDENGGNK